MSQFSHLAFVPGVRKRKPIEINVTFAGNVPKRTRCRSNIAFAKRELKRDFRHFSC